eukprot:gene28432-37531_t
MIDSKINSVSNFESLLSGNVGDSSMAMVNSLKSLVQPYVSVLLSEYIAKKLGERVDLKFLESCRNLLQDNPSWQGWVSEMEVINRIRKYSHMDVWNRSKLKISWKISSRLNIVDENFQDTGIQEDWWLFPQIYNQPCFDVLSLTSARSPRTLRVIQ